MNVTKIEPKALQNAYGIACQRLLPKASSMQVNYGEIAPGQQTAKLHQHPEHEAFVVLEGEALLKTQHEAHHLKTGDVMYVESWREHQICNPFATTAKMLAISSLPLKAQTVYAAPITPNGAMHVGHLAGPYLAADIFYRYHQPNWRLVTGVDSHQNYVSKKAQALQQTAVSVNQTYSAQFQTDLSLAQINPDFFITPHAELTHECFAQLVADGHVDLRTYQQAYCAHCQQDCFAATIAGVCAHCDTPQVGEVCEACGELADFLQPLRDPQCSDCRQAVSYTTRQQYFFKLTPWRQALKAYLLPRIQHPRARDYLNRYFAKEWQDVPLTHHGTWGIKLPHHPDLVYHSYFEAIAGMLDADAEQAVICCGLDNFFYFVLLIPALFMALNKTDYLPQAWLFNDFLNLDKQKISTSRQHAIWVKQACETYGSDALRAFLAYKRPAYQQTNISHQVLTDFIDDFFAQVVPNYLQAYDKLLPTSQANITDYEKQWAQTYQQFSDKLARAYALHSFSPSLIMRYLRKLIQYATDYAQDYPQADGHQQLFALFLRYATPIMPQLCRTISMTRTSL